MTSSLKRAGATSIAVVTHDQTVPTERVVAQPALGHRSVAARAPGQEHDVVVGGERRHEGQPLRMRRVVDRRGEEPVPVPMTAGDVVEAVTGIGDDAVDVDHCDGALLGHTAHRATTSVLPHQRYCAPVTGARRPP